MGKYCITVVYNDEGCKRFVFNTASESINLGKQLARKSDIAYVEVMDNATGEMLYYNYANGSEYTLTNF